jgi:hypothetical protein
MRKAKKIATCLMLAATLTFTVLAPVSVHAEPPGPQSGSTGTPPPPPPPPPTLLELILILLGIV